jgi:hypothetical protein
MIAGTTAIVILIVIAAIHFYWAAGGTAGKASAIPTSGGRPVLAPTPAMTLAVAVAILTMAAILALRVGWIAMPGWPHFSVLISLVTWPIAAVFALRAVGERRYVGFFKTVRDSRFARLDTLVYSPLCAALAGLCAVAAAS